jgi:hypothetical protein
MGGRSPPAILKTFGSFRSDSGYTTFGVHFTDFSLRSCRTKLSSSPSGAPYCFLAFSYIDLRSSDPREDSLRRTGSLCGVSSKVTAFGLVADSS